MIANRAASTASAIGGNLAVSFFMTLMWSVISLDGNPQQESFNRGGIYIVAATMLLYLLVTLTLLGRPMTPARQWFIRCGGMGLMLVAMLLYILVSSILHRRVL